MPHQTKLPAALKRFGLEVKLVKGWETRGSSSFNPKGSVGHHTAGPKTGDRPSLHVCTFGRPGLSGPLCNTFLPRGLAESERFVYVVAAGRANHAGLGRFRGLVGNSSVFGTEAEDDGLDGEWTDWQLWAFPRVQAAQLWIAGRDESWYCSHRTWAPTRKIDPKGISDTWMRTEIRKAFKDPKQTWPIQKPKPKPKPINKPPVIPPKPVEVPVSSVSTEVVTVGKFAGGVLIDPKGQPTTTQKAGDLWSWAAAHSMESHRIAAENNVLLRGLYLHQDLPLPEGVS